MRRPWSAKDVQRARANLTAWLIDPTNSSVLIAGPASARSERPERFRNHDRATRKRWRNRQAFNSDACRPKPQGVADDTDGRQRHRGRGDDRKTRARKSDKTDRQSGQADIPDRRSGNSARRAKWITIGCGLRSLLEIDTSRGYSRSMAARYATLLRKEIVLAGPQAVPVRHKSNERSGTLPIVRHRPWRSKESRARLPSNNIFGRNCGC